MTGSGTTYFSGETIEKDWKKKNVLASELLDYARPRRSCTARKEKLL